MTLVASRSDRNLEQLCILTYRFSVGARGELIPQPQNIVREILLRHPEFCEIPDPAAALEPALVSGPPGLDVPPPEDDGEGDDGLERDNEVSSDIVTADPSQWSHKQLATALAPKHGKAVWSKPKSTLLDLYLEDMTSPA